ncbi:hypothetical protein [Streptomyces sp. NBC_01455]|uniref:hypothetical protein n=1 Tax=Streptomyces sp. NBC_01455 TaxID=2903874 RepID=UPI002E2F3B67|nr:hypothetical protein [Streptomyces sp. NBC_01455]
MSISNSAADERLDCFPLERDLAQRLDGPTLAVALNRARDLLAEVYRDVVSQAVAASHVSAYDPTHDGDVYEAVGGSLQVDAAAADTVSAGEVIVRQAGATPAPTDERRLLDDPVFLHSHSPVAEGLRPEQPAQTTVDGQRAFLDTPRPVHVTAFKAESWLPEGRSMRASTGRGTAIRPTVEGKRPAVGGGATVARPLKVDNRNASAASVAAERQRLIQAIRDEFGVSLAPEAGVAAVLADNPGTPVNVANQVQAMRWDLHSLEQFYSACQHFAPIMGRRRVDSSRGKFDQEVIFAAMVTSGITNRKINPKTYGEYFERNKLVILYRPHVTVYGRNHIRWILTHELAHGLLDYAMDDFRKKFWAGEAPLITASGVVAKNREEDLYASLFAYLTVPAFISTHPRHAQAVKELSKLRSDLFVVKAGEAPEDAAARIAAALGESLTWFGRYVGTWAHDGNRYWPGEAPISEYGETDPWEDFADAVMVGFNFPDALREHRPIRAAFIEGLRDGWTRPRPGPPVHTANSGVAHSPRSVDEINPGQASLNPMRTGRQARKAQGSQMSGATRSPNSPEKSAHALVPERSLDTFDLDAMELQQVKFEQGDSAVRQQKRLLMPGRWDSKRGSFVLHLDLLSSNQFMRTEQFAAATATVTEQYEAWRAGTLAVVAQSSVGTADLGQVGKLMPDILRFAGGLATQWGSVEVFLPNGQNVKVCA